MYIIKLNPDCRCILETINQIDQSIREFLKKTIYIYIYIYIYIGYTDIYIYQKYIRSDTS